MINLFASRFRICITLNLLIFTPQKRWIMTNWKSIVKKGYVHVTDPLEPGRSDRHGLFLLVLVLGDANFRRLVSLVEANGQFVPRCHPGEKNNTNTLIRGYVETLRRIAKSQEIFAKYRSEKPSTATKNHVKRCNKRNFHGFSRYSRIWILTNLQSSKMHAERNEKRWLFERFNPSILEFRHCCPLAIIENSGRGRFWIKYLYICSFYTKIHTQINK